MSVLFFALKIPKQ